MVLVLLCGCATGPPLASPTAQGVVYSKVATPGAVAPTAEELRLQCVLARKCSGEWKNTQFQTGAGGFNPM